jgi:hypothetical protein
MIDYIKMKMRHGNLDDITGDAIKLSIEHKCDVHFEFNGYLHAVSYERVVMLRESTRRGPVRRKKR